MLLKWIGRQFFRLFNSFEFAGHSVIPFNERKLEDESVARVALEVLFAATAVG
jgi:hypothetical protein